MFHGVLDEHFDLMQEEEEGERAQVQEQEREEQELLILEERERVYQSRKLFRSEYKRFLGSRDFAGLAALLEAYVEELQREGVQSELADVHRYFVPDELKKAVERNDIELARILISVPVALGLDSQHYYESINFVGRNDAATLEMLDVFLTANWDTAALLQRLLESACKGSGSAANLAKFERILALDVDPDNPLLAGTFLPYLCKPSKVEMLRILLPRVDMSENYVVQMMVYAGGHMEIIEMLLQRQRPAYHSLVSFLKDRLLPDVGSPFQEDQALLVFCHEQTSGEVQFQVAQFAAYSAEGEAVLLKMLRLPIKFRLADRWNLLLKTAAATGHQEVVKLLLRDNGVLEELHTEIRNKISRGWSFNLMKIVKQMKLEAKTLANIANQTGEGEGGKTEPKTIFAGMPRSAFKNVADFLGVTNKQKAELMEKIGAEVRSHIGQL